METADILAKIRKIEITTCNLVSELFSGEYHSLFKGQGLEFSEVREYQSGDSYRQIDWNVSARMGAPYIKKFEETRELNVLFLVDASASTLFGTRSMLKSEYITEVTAVLSFSALSNNDKVGLLLFTDEIECYIPPRKGRKNALRMLRDILYFEPQHHGTDLRKAIEYTYRLTRKRSIVFVISDFADDGWQHSLRLLARKHDVVALRVIDAAETELPNAGLLHVRDPETGATLTVNSGSRAVRERYATLAAEREQSLQRSFKQARIDLVTLRTDQSYTKELMRFFKLRLRRKNRTS
ncbi:MAG: DUF58 domain-containing protein [Candidatus Cloacimonetes bacterium]|nr:DUF58 domain-containing protein [Candidatus Cloacimonadota bacterium]